MSMLAIAKETRNAILSEKFGFNCTCPACVDDNDPIYDEVVSNRPMITDIVTTFDKSLSDYNNKQIRNMYFYYTNLLKQNFEHFSLSEKLILQQFTKMSLKYIKRPAHSFGSAK